MAIRTIQVNITGSASGVQAAAAQAQRALSGVHGAAVNVGSAASTSMASMYHGTNLVATTLRRIRYELAGVAAAVIGVQGLQALARTVDTYSNISAKIRLATRDATEFAAVQSRLLSIAQETSAPLEGTVALYARTASALKDLGGTQGEVLQLTETINKAFAVSGATIQEQTASVIQLSQGLAAGALRGEEFNSVNEQAPRIMQAIADSLNVTRGQLRGMAFDGKLTAGVIRKALSGEQAQKIAEEYEKIPITIGRAFQQLGNQFLVSVGQLDQARGYSAGLAQAVLWVADNMDTLVGVAALLTEILLAVFGTKLLFNAAAYVESLVKLAKEHVINIALARELGIAQNTGILSSIKSIGILNIAIGALGAALVGWSIGSYLRDEFLEARLFGLAFVRGMLVGWESIKYGAEFAWATIKFSAQYALDYIRGSVADLVGVYASVGEASASVFGVSESVVGKLRDLESTIRGNQDAGQNYKSTVDQLSESHRASVASIDAVIDDMVDYEISADLAAKAAEKAASSADLMSTSLGNGGSAAAALGNGLEFTKDQIAAFNKALREDQDNRDRIYDSAADSAERLGSILSKQTSFLGGKALSAAMEYRDVLVELNEIEASLAEAGMLDAEAVSGLAQARANAAQMFSDDMTGVYDQIREVDQILSQFESPFERMTKDLQILNKELSRVSDPLSDAFDPDRAYALTEAIGRVNHAIGDTMVSNAQDGLRSLQSMADNGSEAFKALQIAIDALTLVQAISAVLNQGNGDPYTAFERMAAMAGVVSAVAGLSISVGGAAGGLGSNAQDRQDAQGTGSVLGDASADSASILNATEITANATSQLVGINRSMLSALQAMQAGLSGASSLLARGAGDAEFAAPGAAPLNFATRASTGALNILTLGLLDGLLGSITRSILGARSKITDAGLLIGGGMLSELLDGITVSAYQEVSSRSWWFGSTHTNTDTQSLGDDVAAQFQLVLDSMADAVRAGAEALGLNMEEVNAAIAAYQIEEIRISTMDLSAEEAQAELEAVFGEIFDGLAGSVVPFIDQFQQVGEGLGETLVRVATGVMVTQEAVRQLGFSLDETDPEKFAQISEGLIEMAGGIDAFISSMSDFVNAFAPESHKFEVAQTALNTAFSEAGLVLPETREGMWDLMQSLDATTESGQRQIATLLRLAGTADSYYTMLEQQADDATQAAQDAAAEQQALLDAQADYSDFIESILRETQQLSTYASAMRDVDDWRANAVEQANAHARAAGAAGASEQALALIEMRAAQMRAVALAQLREETQSLVDQLYGAGDADVGEALTSGIESAGNAAADYWEQQRQSALTLQQYLDSMLLGDTSALTPAEQLAEAWNQLNAAVASGDASSATQLADVYLRLLRGAEASGDDYNSGFWQVRELLQGMLSNVSGATGPTGDNWGGTMTAGEAAQVAETNRLELAVQLAQHLADFSGAIGQTVWELMDSMGINLMSLTEDLGINLDTITGETVLALVNMADLLGVSLTDLTGQMGLTLSDLGDGITDLTTQMGIDLTSMTVASTQSLATLANQLGVDLTELSASVGVDLGNLADSQSLLNQALQAEVAKLPAGQGTALKPYLDAITNATNEADANEAIEELGTYVNTLAPDIRNQLAPYLSNVFPADAMDDLDYLSTLSTTASTQLEVAVRAADLLDRIASNTAASNSAAGVPSYAVGTWNVPATGPAILHAGEMVLPVPMANAWRAGNIGGNGGSDAAVVAELRRIADRLERLERVDAQGTEAIVKAVVATGERSDAANDRSRGQHAAMRRGVTA